MRVLPRTEELILQFGTVMYVLPRSVHTHLASLSLMIGLVGLALSLKCLLHVTSIVVLQLSRTLIAVLMYHQRGNMVFVTKYCDSEHELTLLIHFPSQAERLCASVLRNETIHNYCVKIEFKLSFRVRIHQQSNYICVTKKM